MITMNVSTPVLSALMSGTVSRAQTALATADAQESSGVYADAGLQFGGQSGLELSLRERNDLLTSFTSGNALVSAGLGVATTQLDAMRNAAQQTMQSLTEWQPGEAGSNDLPGLGQASLSSFTAAANAASNGQYVFGGVNSGAPPIADYSASGSPAKAAVDQSFQAYFGFAQSDPKTASISQSSMQGYLDTSFAQLFQEPAWSSTWSSASSANATADVAPGQSVASSASANQPGFAELAQAYAMLSEFGGPSFAQGAQQAVVSTAQSLIAKGQAGLTTVEAGVGAASAAVTSANNLNDSQSTLLQKQLGAMDNVDPYAVATRIGELQTQLQTAYQLTAQLQQLSLAKFLPA